MNKSEISNEVFTRVDELKDAIAILNAAVEQFDAYESYKPERGEVFILRDVQSTGRIVRAANNILTAATESLEALTDKLSTEQKGGTA